MTPGSRSRMTPGSRRPVRSLISLWPAAESSACPGRHPAVRRPGPCRRCGAASSPVLGPLLARPSVLQAAQSPGLQRDSRFLSWDALQGPSSAPAAGTAHPAWPEARHPFPLLRRRLNCGGLQGGLLSSTGVCKPDGFCHSKAADGTRLSDDGAQGPRASTVKLLLDSHVVFKYATWSDCVRTVTTLC